MAGLFGTLDIAASGMAVERTRVSVATSNLANAETTRTAAGGPYRRKLVQVEATPMGPRAARFSNALDAAADVQGAQAVGVIDDPGPLKVVHDPGHPDANANGDVAYPNVEPMTELVDLMMASRAYEANSTAAETARGLIQRTVELLR
ncbi:MAG: flagellar basal body rod protein FlgC [Deltaproteobacteria bacterium]|nr:flagellar basal body rod protein FlgC [Deltaproteobacteria bacterium]